MTPLERAALAYVQACDAQQALTHFGVKTSVESAYLYLESKAKDPLRQASREDLLRRVVSSQSAAIRRLVSLGCTEENQDEIATILATVTRAVNDAGRSCRGGWSMKKIDWNVAGHFVGLGLLVAFCLVCLYYAMPNTGRSTATDPDLRREQAKRDAWRLYMEASK